MTEDNIAHLKPVPTTPAAASPDSFLDGIRTYLQSTGILEEYEHSDVDLEKPTSDERRLGPLTNFETECFVMGQLIGELIRSEMIEIEASGADKITAIMREKKVPMVVAAQEYAQSNEVPEDARVYLNTCAVTQANLLSSYEWSVRSRHNMWDFRLIVREGFIAYRYG